MPDERIGANRHLPFWVTNEPLRMAAALLMMALGPGRNVTSGNSGCAGSVTGTQPSTHHVRAQKDQVHVTEPTPFGHR